MRPSRRLSQLIVLIAILATLRGAARAAELPPWEAPLLVVVETGPGAGCDGAAVRGAIAAELKARVAAPTSPPVGALASQRSDVLLVAIDRERIVITLRGRGERALTRSIASPSERTAKLRAVAWLAGNVARDQLQALVLPDAAPAPPPVGPAAPDDAPLPPTARAPTEPPPVAAPGGGAPDPTASIARAEPIVPRAALPWRLSFGVGNAVTFQAPTVATTQGGTWGLAMQFEAQRLLRGPFFAGAALDAGPLPVHGLGMALLGGVEGRWSRLSVSASLGLGLQTFNTAVTDPQFLPYSFVQTTLEAYARAAVAAGVELASALDLVVQVSGHLAASEHRDAGFVLATLGGRFKWR